MCFCSKTGWLNVQFEGHMSQSWSCRYQISLGWSSYRPTFFAGSFFAGSSSAASFCSWSQVTWWHLKSKGRKNHKQMGMGQNLVPLVNIKIAGKWMFIPLKMVLIGIDPYPNEYKWYKDQKYQFFFPSADNHSWFSRSTHTFQSMSEVLWFSRS